MENKKNKSIGALLLASGSGRRLNLNTPKQFLKIYQKTILEITLDKFILSNLFKSIILVISKDHKKHLSSLKKKYSKITFIYGGSSRQESCYNGLIYLSKKSSIKKIIIHDIVRANVDIELIKKIYNRVYKKNAIIPIISIKDTVKKVKNGKFIENISRKELYLSQTPQGFDLSLLLSAYKKIKKYELSKYTDDAQIYDTLYKDLYTVKGDENNFKITTLNDFKIFKLIYEKKNMISVGFGFDVHAFKKGKHITLFGVKIPFDKSLDGHSDADVGIHSLIDAILGALSLGDIGKLFPDNNKKFKNIDSTKLLATVYCMLKEKNSDIIHIDNTIICEKPKIQKYIPQMRRKISKALKLNIDNISIKATTTESLGFLGREEGIASNSIVTLRKYFL